MGKVLDNYPVVFLRPATNPTWWKRRIRRWDVLMAYAYFNEWDFILMVVKPRAEVLKVWYTLKGELLLIFVASVLVIFVVVFGLTRVPGRACEGK